MTYPAHATWSTPMRISEPGDCWYPQIIAVGDTLHAVYENTGAGYDKISYVRSTDGGDSWNAPEHLSERRGATLIPRIIQDGQRLMVLWMQIFNSGYDRFNIGYSISTDGGASWDSSRYIFEPNWAGIQEMAAAGSGSQVVVVFGTQVDFDFIYYALHSTDFGRTWSAPQEMFACYEGGWLDCAAAGRVVGLAWSGRYDTAHKIEVYYTGSIDGGLTWSESIALSDTDAYHSQLPAIYASDSGAVTVAWMDFKHAPGGATGDIFLRQSTSAGETWGSITELSCGHTAFMPDIVVEGDTLHLAWEDESHGVVQTSIQYVRSTDGGFSWSEPYWLDGTLDDSRYPALAAFNGRVWAAWKEWRPSPDTSGLFFTRYDPESDAIIKDDINNVPNMMNLSAYPNPFNNSTIINLFSAKGGEIAIYNIQGQLIRIFRMEGKEGEIIWDAKDASGKKVCSGIYFAKAMNNDKSIYIKLIYLK